MIPMRLLAAAVLTVLGIACGDSGKPAIESVTAADSVSGKSAPTRPVAIKVALVLKSFSNPFFEEMARGARSAQLETGIDLQIKSTTPETTFEQQARIVENQIKVRVDAIVISPVDTQRLVAVLKKAQDTGIRIVNIDERLDAGVLKANGVHPVPFVGVDSEQAAYQAAKFAAGQIKRKTDAAIFEGIPGTNTSIDRRRGAERAFKENSNLRIVATGAANWKADEAYELAKRVFKAQPDVGVVYCANDLMAIGLIK